MDKKQKLRALECATGCTSRICNNWTTGLTAVGRVSYWTTQKKKVANNCSLLNFISYLSLMHMVLIDHVGLRSQKFLFVSPKSAPCTFSVNSTFCQRASCKNHMKHPWKSFSQ